MNRAKIEDIKGQAARISELTAEKYEVHLSVGADTGWKLVKYSGRDGGNWNAVTSAMSVTKLNQYLMAFIHGAEVVARRYRK